MARRTSRSKTTQATKSPTPTVRGEAPAPAREGSFLKWFLALIVVLIGVDVFNSFHSGKSLFSFKGFSKPFVVQQVVRFTGTATTGKSISANGVAVVGPNELAVVDTSGDRVLIYDFKGKLIRQWGKLGSKGPDEFHEPSSVVSDHNGHLFVMDTWNGAIKGFDLLGHSVGSIDLNHFASFYGPRNIAWGGKYFLVSDVANYRLVKLSLGDQVESVLSGKGKKKGQFMGINYAVVGPEGDWYVADGGGNDRIQVFDPAQKLLRVIKVGSDPSAVALDGNGRLFVGGWGHPSKVFTVEGKFLGTLEEASQPGVPVQDIYSMDVAPDGLLVTSGGDQVTIYQIAQSAKN